MSKTDRRQFHKVIIQYLYHRTITDSFINLTINYRQWVVKTENRD